MLYWYRFIDNLLIIWTGPKELLLSLLIGLNENDFNFKFTYTYGRSKILFLDLENWIQENGYITTDLCCNPNAGNTLLHAFSSHPQPLTQSIPYAQYLQLSRNYAGSGL